MITVIMLTKNNEKTIHQALRSVESFSEVILIDTGSTDATVEIARKFPTVRIFEHPFTGFGSLRNLAMEHASYDWILSLDSDEVLTKEALKELCETSLDPGSIYSFPFHNYFNGKWIRCCGWYPDRHIRLYNRTKTSFSADFVHEGILKEGMRIVNLKGAIDHFSYLTIDDFLRKMQLYSGLFAASNRYKQDASIWTAIGHSLYTFFRSYILQRGFLGGKEGFIISSYQAHVAFYKYLKLSEANGQCL